MPVMVRRDHGVDYGFFGGLHRRGKTGSIMSLPSSAVDAASPATAPRHASSPSPRQLRRCRGQRVVDLKCCHDMIEPVFAATVQATERIHNQRHGRRRTMTGIENHKVIALPTTASALF